MCNALNCMTYIYNLYNISIHYIEIYKSALITLLKENLTNKLSYNYFMRKKLAF